MNVAASSLAIVVGNSKYLHEQPLKNPANDVRAVARSLRGSGKFEKVIERFDLNRREMFALVRELETESARRDSILVYFAGHGMQGRDGQNYLLPVDAKVLDAGELKAEAISASDFLAVLRAAEPRVGLLVLDACRTVRALRGGESRGLARMNATGGNLLVAFSADAGSAAEDGVGELSPYAQAFSEVIGTNGHAGVLSMLDEVARRVRIATNNRQRPTRDGDLEARTSFASTASVPLTTAAVSQANRQSTLSDASVQGVRPPAPQTANDTTDIERAEWSAIADLKDDRAFMRYIARYPNGRFRTAALERLRGVTRTTSGCLVSRGGGDMNGSSTEWSGSCNQGLATGVGSLVTKSADGHELIQKGRLDQGVRVGDWVFDRRGSRGFKETSVSPTNDPIALHTRRFDVNGRLLPQQVMEYKSGVRFEGETNATESSEVGVPHGRGVRTWPDGRRYEGNFVSGKHSGYGVMTFPPSDKGQNYTGDWSDNKQHGRGVLIFRDGSKYEGEFHDGNMHGYGRYFEPSGRLKYAGPHLNNRAVGPNEVR